MGVTGLWTLLEPAGKPVPLESLENKVLAVDVSIWLNQAVKGYRDKSGNAVANAHVLGLFHRICKLLFYRIRPVFVFDGQAPHLKRETLQRRRLRKGDASKKARVASAKILDTYVRSQAVAAQLKRQTHAMESVLDEGLAGILKQRSKQAEKDLFELPPLPKGFVEEEDSSDDSDEDDQRAEMLRQLNVTDIHQMDVNSPEFMALPKETQYELLTELTERRKQSSWSRMHEMPKAADQFSGFQMDRLVKRSKVQSTLNKVGQEIGQETALSMDAHLFVGDKAGLKKAKAEARQIMSSATGQHYLYITGLKNQNNPEPGPSTSIKRDDDDEEEEISQEEIMQMIQNKDQELLCNEEEEEDDDDDIELLEPTRISGSNRSGGLNLNKPSTSQVIAISSSSSDSDSEESFEDVNDEEPQKSLDRVISIEINTDTNQMDDKEDIFADIFEGDTVDQEEVNVQPEHLQASPEKVLKQNIAESMKKSDHLWLKLASKRLLDQDEKDNDNDAKQSPLEDETKSLVTEMKAKQKEQRLLDIKKLDKFDKKEAIVETTPPALDDFKVLANLGVSAIDKTAYETKVMTEEGLPQEEEDVCYGDSASNFVRSKRDLAQDTDPKKVDVDRVSEDTLKKLDDEDSLLSEKELQALQEQLAKEQDVLIAERGHQERLAASISDQMYAECQELLQLFGLPWIVSPSEAEAQCAFLDMIGLSNGTITDDSDVWVFGGQRVYKNFFNQDRHCEYFSAADVGKHFGLSREKMILMALLTGSDYTDGIESVGPVTALEILAEFPGSGMEPLVEFKGWWDQAHRDLAMPPGTKLKEKLRRLRLPQGFPSERVTSAYLNPDVDNSNEKFSWAVPNFVAVRDYAVDKFGWSTGKIDEIIKPVIKNMSIAKSQARIDNYYLTERAVLPEKGQYQSSKRVKEAIQRVLGKQDTSEKVSAKPGPSKKTEKETNVTLPPKDWKKEEAEKVQQAKKRAAEVIKKTRVAKKNKTVVRRKVLTKHNLSESESD